MRKTWCSLLVAVMAAAGLLAACGPAKAPAVAPAAEKPAAAAPAAPKPELTREQQLIEGAKKEGEVIFWVNTMSDPDRFLKPFYERYPFVKVKIWDSEGQAMLNRFAEESKAGRVTSDVWLIRALEIEDARGRGFVTEYEYPNTAGWPYQPKHNFYRVMGGGAWVVGYNTDLVAPSDVPKSWDDLKNSKWAGKAFISTSSITAPLDHAYLWREGDKLNWDKSFSFWTDYVRVARPSILSGYTGTYARLAAGEALILPAAPTSSLYRLQTQGAPLGIAPLGTAIGNSLSLAIMKGSPHPNAARLFSDWLTGPEGLLSWANVVGPYNVVDPKLTGKARGNALFGSLGMTWQPLPAEVTSAENVAKSSEFWVKLTRRN